MTIISVAMITCSSPRASHWVSVRVQGLSWLAAHFLLTECHCFAVTFRNYRNVQDSWCESGSRRGRQDADCSAVVLWEASNDKSATNTELYAHIVCSSLHYLLWTRLYFKALPVCECIRKVYYCKLAPSSLSELKYKQIVYHRSWRIQYASNLLRELTNPFAQQKTGVACFLTDLRFVTSDTFWLRLLCFVALIEVSIYMLLQNNAAETNCWKWMRAGTGNNLWCECKASCQQVLQTRKTEQNRTEQSRTVGGTWIKPALLTPTSTDTICIGKCAEDRRLMMAVLIAVLTNEPSLPAAHSVWLDIRANLV